MDEREGALALLERARSGDRDAFGALAEDHRAKLQRLLFKMTGSPEDAEDLVQETMLRAFRRIAEFELRASFATWLYRIATNVAIDHQRSRKPWDAEKRFQWFHDNGELALQIEQTMYLSPERSAEVKEVAATCVNCVTMSLPEKQRAALILCDQVGLSREEAAQAMNASIASVKTELHRARKKMTDVYEHHCALVDEQNDCDGCLAARRIKRGEPRPASHPLPPPVSTRSAPAACAEIEPLLSDYVDDQLSLEAQARVREHITGCDACTAATRAFRRTLRFVRANADADVTRGTGAVYSGWMRAIAQGDPQSHEVPLAFTKEIEP